MPSKCSIETIMKQLGREWDELALPSPRLNPAREPIYCKIFVVPSELYEIGVMTFLSPYSPTIPKKVPGLVLQILLKFRSI